MIGPTERAAAKRRPDRAARHAPEHDRDKDVRGGPAADPQWSVPHCLRYPGEATRTGLLVGNNRERGGSQPGDQSGGQVHNAGSRGRDAIAHHARVEFWSNWAKPLGTVASVSPVERRICVSPPLPGMPLESVP